MKLVAAELVASMPGRRWGWTEDLSGERLCLQSHDGSVLRVTDARLNPLWECEVPGPGRQRGFHAVSDDLSRIAIETGDEILLLDGKGRKLSSYRHEAWGRWSAGACAFDGDHAHVWALVPSADNVEFVVLTLDGLDKVDSAPIESDPAGLSPIRHPDGRTIGWSIGEGQDRALAVWTVLEAGHIRSRQPDFEDRVLAAIGPGGDEYLTTPHGGGPIQRHRFHDDVVVSRSDQLPDGRNWDFVAGYLNRETVLATTLKDGEEGLVLLDRDRLEPIADVTLRGSADEWHSVTWIGRGRWVTSGSAGAELWRIE